MICGKGCVLSNIVSTALENRCVLMQVYYSTGVGFLMDIIQLYLSLIRNNIKAHPSFGHLL